MAKIAILEDMECDSLKLQNLIHTYEKEEQVIFNIKVFSDAVDFLDKYTPSYDIIFLDIAMPYIDGMSAARKIRDLDKRVILVFTTNLAKYASKGYEVEAFDYILKPITYPVFAAKFRRILIRLAIEEEHFIIINSNYQKLRIPVSTIYYVEVVGHNLVYHTQQGEIKSRDIMLNAENELTPFSFVRINSGYLINLKYVFKIANESVFVGAAELAVSRSRRKEFNEKFAAYVGENH